MYFFKLRKYFLSTLLLELFCHILQPIQADILSTQRKNRNAYTFRFPAERETGFEPATPTLARLYSTPEPLAHFSFFILLSARCTLQMILYRNFPHLSILIFNFFQKNQKTSTIHPIFALLADPAALPPSPPSDLAWLRTCDAGTKPREVVRPFSPKPSESRSAHTDYLRSFSAKYPRV